MPRALFFGFAIVAAFPLHLAAAPPVVEDAPIAPAVAELAERLGVDPARDRVRFMTEVVRLIYQARDAKAPELTTQRPPHVASPDAKPLTVPVPLSAEVWSRAIFHRAVSPDQLIATILSDRRSALLCRGLAGQDDQTLEYLADHPLVLAFLYEHAAGSVSAFGDTLRIRGGRVVPPGGDRAAPLWEAVVGAPLDEPELFVPLLFTGYDGRLAYLYDVVDSADPRAAAFVLGWWMPDDAQRLRRFQVLLDGCARGYDEWRIEEHPFVRPLGDLSVLLLRIRLEPSGAPSLPASRAFWAKAFEVDANVSGGPGGSASPVDAAWIVSATGEYDMYARTERLDQFSFGQRAFLDVTDATSAEAAEVVRQFRQYRMLMLTLERMGIRAPSVYAATLQRASGMVASNASHRFWTLAEFQGAVALLARMRRAGTLGLTASESLLTSLSAVAIEEDVYGGALAQWMRTDLAMVLPRGGTWEDRAIAAMSGTIAEETAPRLSWEGQIYRLDLPLAERQRLEIVRAKQGGHTLDLAVAIEGIGRTLRNPALSVEGVRVAELELKAMASESAGRLRHPSVQLLPPGVELPRDALEWITTDADDLSKITRPGDLRRAPRIGASLQQLSDIVLGNALLSLAYAADIGEPDGAALLAGNVSLRHDFGLARRDNESRYRTLWAIPRQDFQPGVPWHVSGSLLGLDVALGALTLHRLNTDRMAEAPRLSSVEREVLATTVGMMEGSRLKDADRDAIADAITKGRARVNALRPDTFDEVADLLGFDGWRRRAVRWTLQNARASIGGQFSMVDLLALGGGAPGADLDAWGVPGLHSEGCACLRLPSSRAWRMLEGRPQLPMMAATMGDLSLAVALKLREMNLPAALARPVLAVGMQDFLDEMAPVNGNDWWSLSRQAQSLERRRLEDYVSAAAAVNGPLVPEDSGMSREP